MADVTQKLPLALYIAGPMTGLPKFNYPAFNAAAEKLAAAGYATLNPVDAEAHNPTPGTPQPWSWYMRHGLSMVLEADGVALLPGWQKSRGACLEATVAESIGLTLWSVDSWLMQRNPTERGA